MSFLKKGILANYITQYDSSKENPKWVQVSGDSKNGFEDKKKGGYKKAWTKEHYNDIDSCTFVFYKADKEVVDSVVGAVFKFSLPPQSIEITNPQRVFETKTFGGSVIEDYGNDTVNITIQGTTANSDIRSFINGIGKNGIKVNGNGLEELNSFQNKLISFGNQENLNKKAVTLEIAGSIFFVFVKEFSIKQTKDNPLAHSYTITMIGYPKGNLAVNGGKLGYESVFTFKERLNALLKNFNDFVDMVESYLSVLEAGLEYFEDFKDICAFVRAAIERVEKALNNLVNQLLAYVDEVSTCINEVTKLQDLTISAGLRIGLGTVDKALNSVNELVVAVDKWLKFFEDFKDNYGDMSSDITGRWEMTSDEILETCKYMAVSSKQKAEELLAAVQSTTSNCDAAVVPGDKNTDDEIIFVYGKKEYTITANDTWDSIAVKFYGDASKASLLSSFNNQKVNAQTPESETQGSSSDSGSNNGMPSAGTTVYIPVLESTSGFDGTNEVYNQPDVIDNYGHDIRISADGDFDFHNSDIDITEGLETLAQGIINRLSTAVGSRIRDAVYGIKTNIGDTDNTIQTVISSSIEATLLADPRIKSVDDIEFKGNGDKLNVAVHYTDINDRQSVVGGIF